MQLLSLANPAAQDGDQGDNAQSFHQRLLSFIPGVIAGAADLDPAAVLTATVAGASFGYSIAWVVLLCIPVLYSVFAVASRLGSETRRGLVELIKMRYGAKGAFPIALCMIVVNFAMIIGDIVAVSDSLSLILNLPRYFFLAVVGFVVWYILILGDFNKTTKILGSFSLILIAYVFAAWHVTPSFPALAHGVFVPHLQATSDYLMAVIAVFGSLLTPNVIVWQISTKRDLPQASARAAYSRSDNDKSESHAGTFVACLISLSVIVAASHLHVTDASSMTTRIAAEALRPLGAIGPILFSIGIIGSGLVALPILLASLCFSVAEAFGWESGLSKAPWEARFFYAMVSAVIAGAVAIDYFSVNTVKVLYWSQVIAGIVLVPIFIFILLLANDRKIMRTVNTRFENVWLVAAVIGMAISNLFFFWMSYFH
ncbi:MAG: divalent metal cation transporter [Acidobacteriaceae bacterium]